MPVTNLDKIQVGIVDDDESLLRSFARFLSAAGMQPTAYTSAENFCKDAMHPRFDCLVLDVQLPGMSGIELRNKLTSEGNLTPVLFVTAHDDPKAREEAMAGRCAGYFRKTDAGSRLLDALRQAVPSRD